MIRYLKAVLLRITPLSFYQKLRFMKSVGYWPNIRRPTTINEILLEKKIQFSSENAFYTDKYRVRDYIQKLDDIDVKITTILDVFRTPDKVTLNHISEPCFIKSNHGSGHNYFFNPDRDEAIEVENNVKKWFNDDMFYLLTGEFDYKDIKKLVFIEAPLYCKNGSLPDDVKVHCYHGIPSVIQVIRRSKGYLERKTYDREWNEKNYFQDEVLDIDVSQLPQESIIRNSISLSRKFDYVRVDFYNVDGVLYFGELTFYPASAMLPLTSKEVDEELGSLYHNISTNREST